jgi:hypothetical protein
MACQSSAFMNLRELSSTADMLHSQHLRPHVDSDIPTSDTADRKKEATPGEFMQQRRLRLGDIVDDYCPRERRITNHAIVAMIEDAVKQTRCTTCDADHEYKGAKIPAQRRRKDSAAPALVDAPTAGPRKRAASEPPPEPPLASASDDIPDVVAAAPPADESAAVAAAPQALPPADTPDEATEEREFEEDEGPVHRPLIRATLPRPEGHVPERKEPEFTAHQRGDANGNRRGRRRGPRPGQARGPQGSGGTGPARFGSPSSRNGQGQRHGSGFGPRHGSGPGHGQQRQGPGTGRPGRGGRKRGR